MNIPHHAQPEPALSKWKFTPVIAAILVMIGCQSTPKANRPMPQTPKIYHAPAQLFDFDLSTTVLRGKLQLKQSCNVDGTSLDIRDQLGQQVRIDSFNLNDNPVFAQLSPDSSLKQVNDAVIALYSQKYQATISASPKKFNNGTRDIAITRLSNNQHFIDIAVHHAYGQAYAIVLNSPFIQQNSADAQQQLLQLASALSIPGTQLKNSDSLMPLTFDLKNTAQGARQDWRNRYCR